MKTENNGSKNPMNSYFMFRKYVHTSDAFYEKILMYNSTLKRQLKLESSKLRTTYISTVKGIGGWGQKRPKMC